MFMMFLYASVEEVGPSLQKIFFQPFWPQFGLKVRGAQAPRPLPWICHCTCLHSLLLDNNHPKTIN